VLCLSGPHSSGVDCACFGVPGVPSWCAAVRRPAATKVHWFKTRLEHKRQSKPALPDAKVETCYTDVEVWGCEWGPLSLCSVMLPRSHTRYTCNVINCLTPGRLQYTSWSTCCSASKGCLQVELHFQICLTPRNVEVCIDLAKVVCCWPSSSWWTSSWLSLGWAPTLCA